MKHTFKTEKGHLIADVTFDGPEIDKAQDKAVRKLCQNVTVPGFRRGKAPVETAVRYLRNNDVADQTIDVLLRELDKNFEADPEFKGYIDKRRFAENLRPSVALDKFTKDECKLTVTYFLRPTVSKLGDYKGLKSTAKEEAIDDSRIDEEIKKLALDQAELVPVEREAKLGDTVNLDFTGLMNGEPFDGGSSKGFDLELGSKRFVPGFEEACVGHKAGDKFDIPLTLPDNYPEPLTSKAVVFKVTVNSVKEKQIPEVNDEFATTLSGQYVSKDLAELKGKVRNKLEKDSLDSYKRDTVNSYLNQIREASEYEISDEVVDSLVKDRENEDDQSLAQQGLTLDEYLKLIKQDKKTYEASLRTGVEAELKTSLVYNALSEAEKIPAPSNEDLEKQMGMPVNNFVNNYTNYLRSQKLSDAQISNQINGYLNQVFSSIMTARVQARLLELNDPELAKRTFEEPKKEEAPKAEEKPAEAPKAEEKPAEEEKKTEEAK
jgi:trigger factor